MQSFPGQTSCLRWLVNAEISSACSWVSASPALLSMVVNTCRCAASKTFFFHEASDAEQVFSCLEGLVSLTLLGASGELASSAAQTVNDVSVVFLVACTLLGSLPPAVLSHASHAAPLNTPTDNRTPPFPPLRLEQNSSNFPRVLSVLVSSSVLALSLLSCLLQAGQRLLRTLPPHSRNCLFYSI